MQPRGPAPATLPELDAIYPAVPRLPLRRNPLVWALALELCVALALLGVAWHVLHSHPRLPPPLAAALPFATPALSPVPSLALPNTSAARHRSKATLRRDSGFIGRQMAAINREQSLWERAEWTLIAAFTGAARTYIDNVVVPAVERANGH